MKRINQETGAPYRKGDIREDGFIFDCYNISHLKADGYFIEHWMNPVSFQKRKEKARMYYSQNRGKERQRVSDFKLRNRAHYTFLQNKRRSQNLNATTAWADMEYIKDLYKNCAEASNIFSCIGIKFHVDHIIPLQNELVCGLHTPDNLQILEASENCKKSNSFEVI